MNVNKSTLLQFLNGDDKKFVIPVYQRPYSWKKQNCQQLLADLKDVTTYDYPSHFFGAIVFLTQSIGQMAEHTIIDGQQRVTTVSLLLLALHNFLISHPELDAHINPLKIYDGYLIDKYAPKHDQHKLHLIESDQVTYSELLYKGYTTSTNCVSANYHFFYDYLASLNPSELYALYEAITKLNVVNISLDLAVGDDPQLIFESLNSTGLALTETDKIRNFILMGIGVHEQTRFYEDYWKPLEELIPYDEINRFIKYFLAIKINTNPAESKLYFIFKNYYLKLTSPLNIPKVEKNRLIMQEILTYAQYYTFITRPHTIPKDPMSSRIAMNNVDSINSPKDPTNSRVAMDNVDSINSSKGPMNSHIAMDNVDSINSPNTSASSRKGKDTQESRTATNQLRSSLERLLSIGILTYIPLAMELYKKYEHQQLSAKDFTRALETIESYIVRRELCGQNTNIYNSLFISISSEISKIHPEETITAYEVLLRELSRRTGKSRFPNNHDLKEKFSTYELYSTGSAMQHYLLERLENANHREQVAVKELIENGTLSIEHIMPQTLTDDWKAALGRDWESIHNKYKDTIGNLTLTGYNSEYSNRSFLEKKNLPDKGFSSSKLALNHYLQQTDTWTRKDIETRAEELFQKALTIWPYPFKQVETKETNEPTWHDWDEDINWTHKRITKVDLFGTIIYTSRTTDAYKLILHALYDLDPTLFAINPITSKIDLGSTRISRTWYGNHPDKMNYAYPFTDNLYLEIQVSSENKRKIIRALAEQAGINSSDIRVYF